ncbi:MAG: 4Fe-4S dicluster domain-containing protein [Candidatus Bathyarchaeia archaeon]
MSLTDLMSMGKSNEELLEEIMRKLREKLTYCFQCSKCTSGCTAFKLLELTPHHVMELTRLGFIRELIASDIIWTCATCLKCTERCPQKASPYHVIMILRNITVKQGGKIPEAYLKAVSLILESGLMMTTESLVTKKMETLDREKLGLPKIRYPTDSFKTTFLRTLEEYEV